jgi:hypothetical protein
LQSPLSPSRARITAAALASVTALVVPAAARAGTGFTATMHIPTHTPTLGQTWIVTGTATKGAAKLSGRVRYQMIVLGAVQHTDPWKPFSAGRFKEVLVFPKSGLAVLAVGLKMTFSLQLETKDGSKTLNTTIVEQKASTT